jgi:hypothetical protein
MSSCTAAGGCKPDVLTVATTGNERGSASFRARRADRQEVKKWWNHTVTIEVTYCKPLSELSRSEKATNQFLYSGYDNEVVVELAANKLRITATKEKSDRNQAAAQKTFEKLMQEKLTQIRSIEDIQLSVVTEEKTQTRTYEVWEGVDRIG